jgi:hypothetical protein
MSSVGATYGKFEGSTSPYAELLEAIDHGRRANEGISHSNEITNVQIPKAQPGNQIPYVRPQRTARHFPNLPTTT